MSEIGDTFGDFIGGVGGGQKAEPRILFNTGVFWLGGYFIGGAIGIRDGLRNAPNTAWRIRTNAVMNGISKTGTKLSNTLGLLGI